MRRLNAIILIGMSVLIIAPLICVIRAQDGGAGTRGPFIVTRPDKPQAKRKRPAPSNHRLGLGLTIFQEIEGRPVRVSSATRFRSGDRVRLMIEANTDGYLYIFHTENGRSPTMIFPDARLRSDNTIFAHVPYDVPSRSEPPPNDWFVFNEIPATERLYLILARHPLPSVPTGPRLDAYCKANSASCAWQPSSVQWSQIIGREESALMLAQTRGGRDGKEDEGKPETTEETEAATRGFGLPKNAPPPAVVKMGSSEKASKLIAIVDLEHR